MLGAVKYGLRGIFTLEGRDARQTFWYYMLFIYVLTQVVTYLFMIPLMFSMFSTIFSSFGSGGHDPARDAVMMRQMFAGMQNWLVPLSVMLGVANIVLISASLVRRLHDSDLSGWWAVLPGLPYVVNLSLAPMVMERSLDWQVQVQTTGSFANGFGDMIAMSLVLGYAPIVLFVILGVRRSTDGPNRFGEAPVRF